MMYLVNGDFFKEEILSNGSLICLRKEDCPLNDMVARSFGYRYLPHKSDFGDYEFILINNEYEVVARFDPTKCKYECNNKARKVSADITDRHFKNVSFDLQKWYREIAISILALHHVIGLKEVYVDITIDICKEVLSKGMGADEVLKHAVNITGFKSSNCKRDLELFKTTCRTISIGNTHGLDIPNYLIKMVSFYYQLLYLKVLGVSGGSIKSLLAGFMNEDFDGDGMV